VQNRARDGHEDATIFELLATKVLMRGIISVKPAPSLCKPFILWGYFAKSHAVEIDRLISDYANS
jgi:hypothetical protein